MFGVIDLSYPRRIRSLTGVTIGPEATMDYLGVLDLAGGRAANLAHGFDDQLESVHVAFGEVAAAGVERELAVGRAQNFRRCRTR